MCNTANNAGFAALYFLVAGSRSKNTSNNYCDDAGNSLIQVGVHVNVAEKMHN
jgi:hypothetical protein